MLKFDTKELTRVKFDKKEILKANGKENLEIGFFESARYPNGTLVAKVARYQEFGTLRIPMRPFFRNAIQNNTKKWFSTMQQGLKQGKDLKDALSVAGAIASSDISLSITQTNTPPNAQSTIKAKGSTNPLIDTGLMRRSVTYKVKG